MDEKYTVRVKGAANYVFPYTLRGLKDAMDRAGTQSWVYAPEPVDLIAVKKSGRKIIQRWISGHMSREGNE